MCKVFNQVGSLTTIKTHLHNHGINDLKSIDDLIAFQRTYSTSRQQIISDGSTRVNQERDKIKEEIVLLEDFVETCRTEYSRKLLSELEQLKQQLEALHSARAGIFEKMNSYLRGNRIQREIRDIETNFDSKVTNSLRGYTDPLLAKKRRYEFITNNFDKAVQENIYTQLREIDRRKAVVDELNTSIYGAIGEQKVSNELQHLSDDYVLINDFSCSFRPAIYYKQGGDYIQSVQIDHILVAPSGVFLIETKNWSEQSMNNISLRSPVDQIKRSSYALYLTLNGGKAKSLLQHHWGDRKIPIKNLIVMINQKPREEFQYVKVLTLKELRSYVEYFKPIFSGLETKFVANYLLDLVGTKRYGSSWEDLPI